MYYLCAMLEQELHWERDLFFFLNGSDSPVLDRFFYLYSHKWIWIPFYCCCLFAFFYKKQWKEIVWMVLAITLLILVCDQISSGFCKPFFHRFRPTRHPDFMNLVDMVSGYKGGGKYGFPSSHAANAFGFATFAALVFKNRYWTITILLFALLNGYSRIYLGVHFISDVVVGTCIGIGSGFLVYWIYKTTRARFLYKGKIPTQPLYARKESNFLCWVYALMIAILFIFNNQLVNLITP
ncbi:MAG: hypothetical protein EZS26_001679 [Candidatus Ordinivivax streblomastigis]|uniref:Phosphatidic acid phosphatase type 2/haloperoxidase domain-containing protein n=1 Tax=Candidatus Ordinivivax streblomastigis TaxID=2540710 RepID=A0A5M8P106_9BACT|nr:MAG: hypothetical protein EZS26_001679 [Candidatus Ordinivivax streblomastigis]